MPDMKPLRRRSAGQLHHGPQEVIDIDSSDQLGAWLRASGQGDQAAFANVYDELSGLVFGVVRRVVRDLAQSEEITQEVFVDLWRLAPRFDSERGSARSWAATIAHRRAVDAVRSEQASRNRDERDARDRQLTAPPADEGLEDTMVRGRVRRALGHLTELQRESIELAYYGGHTYRDVASLLNIAEGTAKTRIRDGLIRLRDEIGARQ